METYDEHQSNIAPMKWVFIIEGQKKKVHILVVAYHSSF